MHVQQIYIINIPQSYDISWIYYSDWLLLLTHSKWQASYWWDMCRCLASLCFPQSTSRGRMQPGNVRFQSIFWNRYIACNCLSWRFLFSFGVCVWAHNLTPVRVGTAHETVPAEDSTGCSAALPVFPADCWRTNGVPSGWTKGKLNYTYKQLHMNLHTIKTSQFITELRELQHF